MLSCHKSLTTAEFAVNGSAIPEVNFDAGESYAGQLPIGGNSDGKLYFWFWPTTNPDQPKEILIWLNGGVRAAFLRAPKSQISANVVKARLLIPRGFPSGKRANLVA